MGWMKESAPVLWKSNNHYLCCPSLCTAVALFVLYLTSHTLS